MGNESIQRVTKIISTDQLKKINAFCTSMVSGNVRATYISGKPFHDTPVFEFEQGIFKNEMMIKSKEP